MLEIEAKIKIENIDFLSNLKLKSKGKKHVYDIYYDDSNGSIEKQDKGLRIRKQEDEIFLAYKGPRNKDTHLKEREEVETKVKDWETAKRIIQLMGFKPIWKVEKYRETFYCEDYPNTKIEIDNYPFIGLFVEVEGQNVEEVVEKLGLDLNEHIPKNNVEIFLEYCEKNKIENKQLTFEDERDYYEDQNEEIVIVDENDNVIGKTKRNHKKKNQRHRVSVLWIKNKEDKILFARRAYWKPNHPGVWGPSVVGTNSVNETYEQNIIKEAKEELGLDLENYEKGKKEDRGTHFTQVFFATMDNPKINFNYEVVETIWLSKEEILEKINKNPKEYHHRVKEYIESIQ